MSSSASSGTEPPERGGAEAPRADLAEAPRADQAEAPRAAEPEVPIHVVVEIPKGSRNKYELDHETGRIRLDRMLFSPVHYPTDYGFVPDTLAEDGDPLDALVLLGEPTFPGCEIQARIVGMLDMADDAGRDQKLLVVPLTDPHWNHIYAFGEVAPHLLREIEHFFTVYKQLEDKTVEVFGWRDADTGRQVLAEALTREERHRQAGHGGSTVGA